MKQKINKNTCQLKINAYLCSVLSACGVMVAASDLGSDVSGRGGSSPFMRTKRLSHLWQPFFC